MADLSDKEKLKIKEETKEMMDSFFLKLNKLKFLDLSLDESKDFERVESLSEKGNISRKIMFDNAKQKNENFILSEKGDWS